MTTPQELLAMTREKVREAIAAHTAKRESRLKFKDLGEMLDNEQRTYKRILSCNEPDELADAIMAILPGDDTRDAVIEECIAIVNGRRIIHQTIGPLYQVGWNSAADHFTNALRALKSPP